MNGILLDTIKISMDDVEGFVLIAVVVLLIIIFVRGYFERDTGVKSIQKAMKPEKFW